MAVVIVKTDRAKKLRNFYPWIYGDELEDVQGEANAGDVVQVRDSRGAWIGLAFYSPSSHIRARMLSFDSAEKVDRAFFERRFESAIARRNGRIAGTNAQRLIHAEADQVPGLIVDRYADSLVLQVRNAGIENAMDQVIRALKRLYQPHDIYERSDTQARLEENLPPRVGAVFGETPEEISIYEDDVQFLVNPRAGQKTGFYLDQRDNRRLLRSICGEGSRLLDAFSYTGGFSLHAGRAGASTLAVDKDRFALERLENSARLNGLENKIGVRWGEAEEVLKELAYERRSFSHIVLDPPTLAKHKNDVPPVKQSFTRFVTGAMDLLEPNGIIFLSSCAFHISANDLIEAARIAAGDQGRRAELLTITYQPADHPWILQIPETLYLKTLILRVA